MTTPKIRTLVVDDSVFMRTVLKSSLANCPAIEVIGSAQNGKEALEKIKSLKPYVVTLDIEMPGVTGLEVLKRVMRENPIPIVMVSTKTQKGAQMTFEALDLGAVDYVAKPLADKKTSLQKFQEKVVNAVQAAFSANLSRLGKTGQTRVLRPRQADLLVQRGGHRYRNQRWRTGNSPQAASGYTVTPRFRIKNRTVLPDVRAVHECINRCVGLTARPTAVLGYPTTSYSNSAPPTCVFAGAPAHRFSKASDYC